MGKAPERIFFKFQWNGFVISFYAGVTTEETLQSAAVNNEDFDVERFDAVVIGAGAAGMFCAAMAGQAGRRVLLLDNGKKPGRKILMSGGGRCNFTNLYVEPAA